MDLSVSSDNPTENRLASLVNPSTVAVVTMEMQNGIIGPEALFPQLPLEVERLGLLATATEVCREARRVGAQVVHCTKVARPDGKGDVVNCKVFALGEKKREELGRNVLEEGTPGAQIVEGLQDELDMVVPRLHGMTPFMSTSLDQILRNLGIRTIIAVGVSANLGIIGLSLNGVDLGYNVIVVRDAIAGLPSEYTEVVLANSLSLVATIVDSRQLVDAWERCAT